MTLFKLERLRVLMEPQENNEYEAEGVINPAAARGPDGNLYIFPRLVGKNNFSRIGIARVNFDDSGDPIGVERLGVVLEPETDYETRPDGGGGCEDPRITYVEPVEHYIMTYTAFGPNGPRIAMAKSKNLFDWERLGLVEFLPYENIHFTEVDNKDASFFPVALPSPHYHRSIAMLHRPLFAGTRPEDIDKKGIHDSDERKESIFISYFNLKEGKDTSLTNAKFTSHHRLAHPVYPWENLKIGGGAPPVLTKHGWMLIYHGVRKEIKNKRSVFYYSAGVMILSEQKPQKILYRSSDSILIPDLPERESSNVYNVVFPTGTDRRDDIGQSDRVDVYYGMDDKRIGVAKMQIPDTLP